VRSVAILLRREADSPSLTGHHQVLLPHGPSYLDFRYSVLGVWMMDVEVVLTSGLGAPPLAPLTKVKKKDLPAVINRMKARFEREVSENESNLLWTATKILMGMRYSKELVASLLKGVQGMKESVTYQAILVEGEQRMLIRMGRKRLGEPSPEIVARIESIGDESILSTLADRLFDVSSWDELLTMP
jgi:predicted transposase YdaD